jgi:glycosyltransferase involved in cell wall biosynthesis
VRAELDEDGVSFIVPVRNGARWLPQVLDAIGREAAARGRPFELVAVIDGSRDGSARTVREHALGPLARVVSTDGVGAAAALNAGLNAARYPLVCQIDQDVVPDPGWLAILTAGMTSERVAAVQGRYVAPRSASIWSRVTALDLDQRYRRVADRAVNHVCTGNTLYRRAALDEVGGFDPALGYGYDNDLSYRLGRAGYELRISRDATAIHDWRESAGGYFRQQYGLGYGRLDLIWKHPSRIAGDDVGHAGMILHAALMATTLVLLAASVAGFSAGHDVRPSLLLSGALVAILTLERGWAGLRAVRTSGDPAGHGFVPVHLVRDLAWTTAIVVWFARSAMGRGSHPSHSMIARDPLPASCGAGLPPARETLRRIRRSLGEGGQLCRPERNVLALIPAHNEAESLPALVRELRDRCPGLHVLVVDDGSTDATADVVQALGIPCLRLHERVGLGRAVRAGLRYASMLGYDIVVRLDGDGQHPPSEISALVAPILAGHADAVVGSRTRSGADWRSSVRRSWAHGLALSVSCLVGQRMTDATSGFWAFGPRAVRILSRHHPTGYPEPELLLFLRRNRLRVSEVGTTMKARATGRTSLRGISVLSASARVLLAMIVVPLRPAVSDLEP